MTATRKNFGRARFCSALLVGTMLGGASQPLFAQDAAPPQMAPAPAAAPTLGTIKTVNVSGSERLEADTVRSYVKLVPGETYTREALDEALKELYETELFADVQVRDDGQGNITLQVRENPVVNRIVLEGNKRLKSDKINPEIKLAPRQIFTRSKVRADVARIVELYRRQGRFAATVEPKMVQLDQNRVDIIFEISEGDKSKVRKINIIGNEKFSDGRLRGEMATKQTGITKIFSSGTSYDPDRMSYDQQKLRQYYLTQGYADFRVVSAVAELTPDKKDFIITYVVEEGQRYKFGDVSLESEIRDIKADTFKYLLPMKKGDWYNAKAVEDTVDAITEATGVFGFTPDVRPDFNRDKDDLTMGVVFKINQSPRVYVERIDINGNTHTKDKVVRREFRLSEGDAFNSFKVKRSRDRIQSLGFFQDKFEIEQKPGSAPDRVVLEANVEEKSTGELQVSAGYSSLERFIVDLSIRERNFMGKGQEVRAGVSYSTYSKSIELGFTEPYVFDKNIAVGFDVFRRDYNSFNFSGNDRNTTYEQTTTGFQIRAGIPLTEFITLATRYGLSYDQVSLNKFTFYTDTNNDGIRDTCDPIVAGRYLCDAIGNRLTSSVGYSLVFDNLNNRLRPTRGQRAVFSQDFAGLGGTVRYIKTTAQATKYWGIGSGFVFSASAEGGYIKGLGQQVRLIDRFYLGEPDMRGFGIRGVGPRVIRSFYDTTTGTFLTDRNSQTDDALGGNAYYRGRLELEIPLGNGARELGLRPSIFMDVGAVFGVSRPRLTAPEIAGYPFQLDANGKYLPVERLVLDSQGRQIYTVPLTDTTNPGASTLCQIGYSATANGPCVGSSQNTRAFSTISPFREDFVGNTAKPRLSVGFGVNWNSPFGPFRIDIAKALLKEKGDNTKTFQFNVGTQF
ncbi:outer membrane protein assembly factor BamA [Rhizorhabdus phycosphaerae]|uniref:outer membrane protein assembly factor BamA n=1 Tax=Rhizorhabdus phycosphaerae TaxID=2711156 RepID=UPI0019D0AFCC|nr:outer membrane protein assembly factor BamA [Rhizorhabdus phycosphaerae]